MFGFSLGKFLLLAIIVGIFWYGWKYARRVEQLRRALREEMARRRGPSGAGADDARSLPAEDLVKCSACGAYVPGRSAQSCGRADCPW
jgi:uncharacterized protein